MNSRKRVEMAVNFKQPDRVPIDLGGMKASGIAVTTYARLKQCLGIASQTRVLDPRFMIAEVEENIRQRLHIDVVPLDLSWISYGFRNNEEWIFKKLFDGTEVLFPPDTRIMEDENGNWVLLNTDGSRTSYRMPKDGFYFDDIAFNIEHGDIDPKKFKPQTIIPDEHLKILSSYGKYLYENTDYAILGWGGGVCFLGMSLITERTSNVTMGMLDKWMMMLMTEKETCHEMMNKSVEASINCLKLINQAAGKYCFAWGIAADDSGTQRCEFIRPELWADMIKPHYKKLCDWIHKNTKMKTFFHCCGSIYNLIPHLIDAGIDILNPVQTSAANMDPIRLKQEFGDKLVFWGGGCDTQEILSSSPPEEVKEHVKKRLEIFGRGGGYVFNQIHNIQANVPVENVIAMFESAYEYGRYRK